MLLVAVENLVASLARYAELATQMAHLLAFQQASHKPKALLHHRTLFPRHRQFPPAIAGGNCYPCVRYELSPMSRVAHEPQTEGAPPSPNSLSTASPVSPA